MKVRTNKELENYSIYFLTFIAAMAKKAVLFFFN